jgi:hypothetical protein
VDRERVAGITDGLYPTSQIGGRLDDKRRGFYRGAPVSGEEFVRRTLTLAGLTTLALNLASFGTGTIPPRTDSSRAALISLGREYGDLKQWATAIAEAADTLESAERARALAHQLARVMGPLEKDFEKTTAALSTSQLEQILPLWERMVFAHAGFALLQEKASTLGLDPTLDPAELHDLAFQLSVVLDFAAQIQRLALTELITPPPTPARLS